MASTLFDHERLEAYNVAREANRAIGRLIKGLPGGTGEIVDQLRRAQPVHHAEHR